MYDTDDGTAYYFNTETEESVWEMPDQVLFAMLDAQAVGQLAAAGSETAGPEAAGPEPEPAAESDGVGSARLSSDSEDERNRQQQQQQQQAEAEAAALPPLPAAARSPSRRARGGIAQSRRLGKTPPALFATAPTVPELTAAAVDPIVQPAPSPATSAATRARLAEVRLLRASAAARHQGTKSAGRKLAGVEATDAELLPAVGWPLTGSEARERLACVRMMKAKLSAKKREG